MSYNLYFDEIYLGEIDRIGVDDFYQTGIIEPADAIEAYRAILDYLVDETEHVAPPENFEELIFGKHWFIIDDKGERRQITAPYVHRDNEIGWQWIEWKPG